MGCLIQPQPGVGDREVWLNCHADLISLSSDQSIPAPKDIYVSKPALFFDGGDQKIPLILTGMDQVVYASQTSRFVPASVKVQLAPQQKVDLEHQPRAGLDPLSWVVDIFPDKAMARSPYNLRGDFDFVFDFQSQENSDLSFRLGPVSTNPNGEAEVFLPINLEPGIYQVQVRSLKSSSENLQADIRLEVRSSIREETLPVVALDLDWMIQVYGWEKACARIKSLLESSDLDFILINNHENPLVYQARKQALADQGILAPLLHVDEYITPVHSSISHHESQVEKLKALRGIHHIPLVGIITDPKVDAGIYQRAGMSLLREAELGYPQVLNRLNQNLSDYEHNLTHLSRDDFYLNQMTDSSWINGNEIVEELLDSDAAKAALFSRIDAAQDHILIRNFIFHSQGDFAQALMEKLKAKASEGVKVVVLVDQASILPYPGPIGMSYLQDGRLGDPDRLTELREAGVHFYFHPALGEGEFEPEARLGGFLGPRLHRKGVLVDGELWDGGFTLTSLHFNQTVSEPTWATRVLQVLSPEFVDQLAIGLPPFKDSGWVLKGPIVDAWLQSFKYDLARYGELTSEEMRGLDLDSMSPSLEIPDGVSLRSITHDRGEDQNCYNTLEFLLEHPQAKRVIISNSFEPSLEMIDLMKRAVDRGVTVEWWLGPLATVQYAQKPLYNFYQKLFLALEAGITVKHHPAQRHDKLYMVEFDEAGTAGYLVTGAHNPEGPSLMDSEALVMASLEEDKVRDYGQAYKQNFYQDDWVMDLNQEFPLPQTGRYPSTVRQEVKARLKQRSYEYAQEVTQGWPRAQPHSGWALTKGVLILMHVLVFEAGIPLFGEWWES